VLDFFLLTANSNQKMLLLRFNDVLMVPGNLGGSHVFDDKINILTKLQEKERGKKLKEKKS